MQNFGQKFILYGIIVGVLAGGASGWLFGETMTGVSFIGEIFLNALKLIIVPLIFFSMISGVASLGDIRRVGRTGLIAAAFFLSTTLIAVVLGLFLVTTIKPGEGFEHTLSAEDISEFESKRITEKTPTNAAADILRSIVSPNILQSAANNEVLPVIFFALLFGGALTTLGEKGSAVLKLCEVINSAIIKIVHLIMLFAPFGIFALVASQLGKRGGGAAVMSDLMALGWYAFAVLTGLAIHGFVILPLIVFLVARRNPFTFTANMLSALITAFSTASSSATLPVTMECVKERNKVPEGVANFVLPLGATVNMDGTALYEAVAVVFIGQAFGAAMGIELGAAQLVIIAITATLAAIGAAGIPEAGLVTMLIVFNAVHYPPEVIEAGLAVILVIDWFLDRCRTAINVYGDSVGSAVVERFGKGEK